MCLKLNCFSSMAVIKLVDLAVHDTRTLSFLLQCVCQFPVIDIDDCFLGVFFFPFKSFFVDNTRKGEASGSYA